MDAAFLALEDLRRTESAEALDRFAREVGDRLPAYARRLVGAGPDADDVVQDAWLKACRFWPACRAETPAALGGWLFHIARSCASGVWGARKRAVRSDPPEEADPGPGPEERATNRARGEAYERLLEAEPGFEPAPNDRRLGSWSRKHRVATTPAGRARDIMFLVAMRVQGASAAEAAAAFGTSPATASKAAQRGEAALRARAAALVLAGVGDLLLRAVLYEIAGDALAPPDSG